MKAGTKTIGATRLFWSLVLGLGLALGLLWAMMPRAAVEAQPVNHGFTVDLAYEAVWGLVNPGDVVTVTRTAGGAAYGAAEADGVGFFWTPLWQSNGQPADIVGGNTLAIYVNGALAATLSPLDITGQVDVLADRVTGNVSSLTPGVVVTVTLGDLGQMVTDEPQATDAVDGGGDFVADFSGVADIGPHEMGRVQYLDANGNTVQAYVYPSEVFRVRAWNTVEGYAAPSAPVTATVYSTYPTDVRWTDSTTAQSPHGTYSVEGDVEYGDVVEVNLGGGTVISVVADYLEMRPDAPADQIVGVAPAGAHVRGYIWNSIDGIYDEDTDTADGSGNYTLTLGVDLRTGHWPYVAYADAEGDEIGFAAPPPHILAYPQYNALYAVADHPNQSVTYTVDTGTEIFTKTAECGKRNTCDWTTFDSVAPGYIITADLPSSTMVMTVVDLSVHLDTANDRALGQVNSPGRINVHAWQWLDHLYPANGNATVSATASSPFTATFSSFDIRDVMGGWWAGHWSAVSGHRTFIRSWTGPEDESWHWETAYFEVEIGRSLKGVSPNADEIVTATLYTADGVELASTSDDWDDDPWRFELGGFGDYLIVPGCWVTVTSESGWTAGLQVPYLTTQADEDTDLIWGEGPKALLFVEHGGDSRFVPCDGYALDTAFFGHDLQRDERATVYYQAPNGNRVLHKVTWPLMGVSYGEDWVGADYAAGHTFCITVTDSGGTVKATAAVSSTFSTGWHFGGWEGSGGFETTSDDWSPAQPDIKPGDRVYFESDDGYSNVVRVGTIGGTPDADNDSVSGPIYATWFTQTLDVECYPKFPCYPFMFKYSTAEPDGSVPYLCQWDPATEWDIQPKDTVRVRYIEPDGDTVINVFRTPWRVFLPLVLRNYP